MKRLPLLLLPLIVLLLFGCPLEQLYPLDTPGSNPIDTRLIGTWVYTGENADNDMKKINVNPGTDSNSYAIEVVESGSAYTIKEKKFTGYVTGIDGKKFIYVRPEGAFSYYTYCYDLERDSSLVLWNVKLLEEDQSEVITSIQDFRSKLKISLRESGCLTDETRYEKQ